VIFYYAPQTVAVASHIALEEACAEYEHRKLDFSIAEQRSHEYLQINPKGRVPSLETGEGIISETPAILVYIAQTFPKAQLAPLNDPFEFAKMQEFNVYLASTVHVNHAHKLRGIRWTDDRSAIDAMKVKVPQTMHDSFDLIENEMFTGPWVLGGDYSVCDCYLFCISLWLEGDGVDIGDFPKIAEHNTRMRDRASVQTVLPIHRLS
jgi:glutathione S-transferase